MHIQFIRHAAFIVHINGLKILVDPMLGPKGAMDPIKNTANQERIPLVELPFSNKELKALLDQLDGILVTHVHRDHWDTYAVNLIPKSLPIFCQTEDEAIFLQAGFSSVYPITIELEWHGLRFIRTGGQHGAGEIGKKMGTVSGFVLQTKKDPILYIAGDTIWCSEVKDALHAYKPDVVVLNTGEASFLTGGRITMNSEDVSKTCRELPTAKIIAIHLEAVNHCFLTRAKLKKHLEQEGITSQVMIPMDGEVILCQHQ
jgi:L-ascorbate metabolism protein UlaG (beta-lactamase superfamily)